MPLRDYSHAFVVGENCTPVKQLQLAAQGTGLPMERIKGPFDWLIAPLPAVIEAIRSRFDGFFDRRLVTLDGYSAGYWRVHAPGGLCSLHHFPRHDGDAGISAHSWARFDRWLGDRINRFEMALAHPANCVLILRLQSASQPDDPEALAELCGLLTKRAQATVRVAAVSYQRRPSIHEHVPDFVVEVGS